MGQDKLEELLGREVDHVVSRSITRSEEDQQPSMKQYNYMQLQYEKAHKLYVSAKASSINNSHSEKMLMKDKLTANQSKEDESPNNETESKGISPKNSRRISIDRAIVPDPITSWNSVESSLCHNNNLIESHGDDLTNSEQELGLKLDDNLTTSPPLNDLDQNIDNVVICYKSNHIVNGTTNSQDMQQDTTTNSTNGGLKRSQSVDPEESIRNKRVKLSPSVTTVNSVTHDLVVSSNDDVKGSPMPNTNNITVNMSKPHCNSKYDMGWRRRTMNGIQYGKFIAHNILGSRIESEKALLINAKDKISTRTYCRRRSAVLLNIFRQLKKQLDEEDDSGNTPTTTFHSYFDAMDEISPTIYSTSDKAVVADDEIEKGSKEHRRKYLRVQPTKLLGIDFPFCSNDLITFENLESLNMNSLHYFQKAKRILSKNLTDLHKTVQILCESETLGYKILSEGLDNMLKDVQPVSSISRIQLCIGSPKVDKISMYNLFIFERMRWYLLLLILSRPLKKESSHSKESSKSIEHELTVKRKLLTLVLSTTTLRSYLSVAGHRTPPLMIARRSPHPDSECVKRYKIEKVNKPPSYPPRIAHMTGTMLWPGASHINWVPSTTNHHIGVATTCTKEPKLKFPSCSVLMNDMISQTPWEIGADPTVFLQLFILGFTWPGFSSKILSSEQSVQIPDQRNPGTLCCFPPLKTDGSCLSICEPDDPLVPQAYQSRLPGSDEDPLDMFRMSYQQQQQAISRRKPSQPTNGNKPTSSGGTDNTAVSEEIEKSEAAVTSSVDVEQDENNSRDHIRVSSGPVLSEDVLSDIPEVTPEEKYLARVSSMSRTLPSIKQLNAQRSKLLIKSLDDQPMDNFIAPCAFGLRRLNNKCLQIMPETLGPNVQRWKDAVGVVERPLNDIESFVMEEDAVGVDESSEQKMPSPLVSPTMHQRESDSEQELERRYPNLSGLWNDPFADRETVLATFTTNNFAKMLPVLRVHPGLSELFCMVFKLIEPTNSAVSGMLNDNTFREIITVGQLAILVEKIDRVGFL